MQARPTIVCLCGSTRFYDTFQRVNCEETLAGKIVLSVGFFSHASQRAHGQELSLTPAQKAMLDELHQQKIDLTDEIYVLNVDDYVGASTRRELAHARSLGKRIGWYQPSRHMLGGERVHP